MYCMSPSFYLWLPCQDSRLNGGSFRRRACVAAGVTPWQSSQWGQGSDLCGLVLLRRKVKSEKLLNGTIKYDKMGWACLGILWTYCTGKCHMSHVLLTLRLLRQQPGDRVVTLRRRNLGRGMTVVVQEMNICAMLEQ